MCAFRKSFGSRTPRSAVDPYRPRMVRQPSETWDDCLLRYCKLYGIHHDGPLCAFFALERIDEKGPDHAAHEVAWAYGIWDDIENPEDRMKGGRTLVDFDEVMEGRIPSIEGTCRRCGHSIVVWGRTDRSYARCLATMREECRSGYANFYMDAADCEDDDGS